jgi:hypothetical protein
VPSRKAAKDVSAASLKRGGKTIPFLKDDIVANLPGTAQGGSQPTPDKDESAASLRRGGKSIPFLKEDIVANLPGTAQGGSQPTPDKDELAAALREGAPFHAMLCCDVYHVVPCHAMPCWALLT